MAHLHAEGPMQAPAHQPNENFLWTGSASAHKPKPKNGLKMDKASHKQTAGTLHFVLAKSVHLSAAPDDMTSHWPQYAFTGTHLERAAKIAKQAPNAERSARDLNVVKQTQN